jgi:hypothetical protein
MTVVNIDWTLNTVWFGSVSPQWGQYSAVRETG